MQQWIRETDFAIKKKETAVVFHQTQPIHHRVTRRGKTEVGEGRRRTEKRVIRGKKKNKVSGPTSKLLQRKTLDAHTHENNTKHHALGNKNQRLYYSKYKGKKQ